MRIKINGEEISKQKIVIETYEASTIQGLFIVIMGAIFCVGWWFMW